MLSKRGVAVEMGKDAGAQVGGDPGLGPEGVGYRPQRQRAWLGWDQEAGPV